MNLRNSEQLLRVVFSTFGGKKKIERNTQRGSIESMSTLLEEKKGI